MKIDLKGSFTTSGNALSALESHINEELGIYYCIISAELTLVNEDYGVMEYDYSVSIEKVRG